MYFRNVRLKYMSQEQLDEFVMRSRKYSKIKIHGCDLSGLTIKHTPVNMIIDSCLTDNLKFIDSDLSNLEIVNCDLSETEFINCNIVGMVTWDSNGDGIYIKTIPIEEHWYHVNYTHTHIQIGCKNYTIEEWEQFDNCEIQSMDGDRALTFWDIYKDYILSEVKNNPAKKPS